MEVWFTQLTRLGESEIAELLAGHPRTAKARLAREVVAQFHGAEAAAGALDAFDRQFKQKQLPDDIPDKTFGPWPAEGVPLAILLRELGLAQSSSEARRLIQQGAVKLEGEAQKDPNFAVPAPGEPLLIQVGKRRFARVSAQG